LKIYPLMAKDERITIIENIFFKKKKEKKENNELK
jgi:hypothetical protein